MAEHSSAINAGSDVDGDSAINGGGGWDKSKTLRGCAIAGGDCGGLHDIPFRLAEVVVDVKVGVDAHGAGAVFPRGGAVGEERRRINGALGLDLGKLAEDHLGCLRGEEEIGIFDVIPDELHEVVAFVIGAVRLVGRWRGHLLDVAAVGAGALRRAGDVGDEPVAYLLEAGALVLALAFSLVGRADGRDVVQEELEPVVAALVRAVAAEARARVVIREEVADRCPVGDDLAAGFIQGEQLAQEDGSAGPVRRRRRLVAAQDDRGVGIVQGVEVGAGVVAIVEPAAAHSSVAAHVAGVDDVCAASEEATDEEFQSGRREERVLNRRGGWRDGRAAALARGVAYGNNTAAPGALCEGGGAAGIHDEYPLLDERAAGGEAVGKVRSLGAFYPSGKVIAYPVEHTRFLLKV